MRSAATVFAFFLFFALRTVLLLRCRLRERLPSIAIPDSPRVEGWLKVACDQSSPSPGTAALTLSHARSWRHDHTLSCSSW